MLQNMSRNEVGNEPTQFVSLGKLSLTNRHHDGIFFYGYETEKQKQIPLQFVRL